MPSIDPSPEQFEALKAADREQPIVMINLLRFREQAEYAADFEAEPCTGAEAYARYGAEAVKFVNKVGGRPIWGSEVAGQTIGPADEDWDQALLVHYPSRAAFLQMVTDPGYQAIVPHRAAALADSRLICCTGDGGIVSVG